MKNSTWRKRLLETTRGQILALLRTRDRTVNDLAAALRLTDNAVRAHLMSLGRDGLIQQSGTQSGFRKPHVVYALTSEAEQVFPKSYGLLLSLVLEVVGRKLSLRDFRRAMRDVGRAVARDHMGDVAGKTRKQRIEVALRILSDLGGAVSLEKMDRKHLIRGRGCPIAAATSQHPEACLIAESLLTEVIGAPVKEHCVRGANPSCYFEIG